VSTNVRAFLPLAGDVPALTAAFEADASRWLPDARRDGGDRWLLTVRAGALSRTVRALVGAPWRAGTTSWRAISWDPVGHDGEAGSLERFLPSLDGELGLHVDAAGGATLILDGRYQPPGGPLGAAADAVALHRVARHTVERFLEQVAAGLSAEATLAPL
jgi:hypothetical protein